MHFSKLTLAVLPYVLGFAVSYTAPSVKINDTILYGLPTDTISDNGHLVSQFLGIPYAPQPVRFSPAKPLALTSSSFKATAYGPVCIQEFVAPTGAFVQQIFNAGKPKESEDCLSLNVWTPTSYQHKSSQFPVLFWIYGGSLQFGGSNQIYYNGTNLASHDTVVVTINYRTNVFGFPSGTQIPANETNLGLLDQRLALQWVRDNIASFGGDKNRITIFGQSAGSFSVDSLVLQGPAKNPPFHSAILESGVLLPSRAVTRGPLFNALAKGCGCNQGDGTAGQLECLRSVPATRIKQVEENLALAFGVVVDNITIYEDAYARRFSGHAAAVPIMIGTTQDEGSIFTYGQTNFAAYIQSQFPTAPLAQLKALYPVPQKYASDNAALAALFRDLVFTCPVSIVSQLSAKHVPTYRYLYDAQFNNTSLFPGSGVYHASEIPIVFGTYPEKNATSAEVALSTYMQGVWAGFARNPRRGPWPKVGSFAEDLAVIGSGGSSGTTMKTPTKTDAICRQFWDYVIAPGKDLSALTRRRG